MARTVTFEVDLAGGRAGRRSRRVLDGIAHVDDAFAWGTLDPSAYSKGLVERARAGWTENAFNEHCTAVAIGQLIEAMGVANVPLDLWALACSFAPEELLHVELCSRVAMELGGGAPIVYDPDDLVLELDASLTPLQRASELVVRLCCVGEAFSFPMLKGSMKAATHPLTRGVLAQIVKDEAMHGQLGWMVLDWIANSLDRVERSRLHAAAVDAAAGVQELCERTKVSDRAADEPGYHDMGWMSPRAYLDEARRALEVDVFERLAAYGIVAAATSSTPVVRSRADAPRGEFAARRLAGRPTRLREG
jgi:hypothetical protein